jgi:aminopeptidase-like protein
VGAIVVGCCVGDDSGDKLARDERSEEAIDDLCEKVLC